MEQNISGILVVDKPVNMSSAAVVGKIKKLINARKVGHTGTLDPFATGVLVCCVNKATRLARFLLKGIKKYEALLCLGVSTDTQDATGTEVDRVTGELDISEKLITEVFDRFKGTTKQQPPAYSALKLNGVPLYKLARAGKPVQKPPRQIEIIDLNITHIDLPYVQFEVTCSAGTYIRTLCADIGHQLGCGGHLKELRRTSSGGFSIDQAVSLTDLESLVKTQNWSNALIKMKAAVDYMPVFRASGEMVDKIKKGIILTHKDVGSVQTKNSEGLIQVLDNNDDLIAVINNDKKSPFYSYCCVLI